MVYDLFLDSVESISTTFALKFFYPTSMICLEEVRVFTQVITIILCLSWHSRHYIVTIAMNKPVVLRRERDERVGQSILQHYVLTHWLFWYFIISSILTLHAILQIRPLLFVHVILLMIPNFTLNLSFLPLCTADDLILLFPTAHTYPPLAY